MVSTRPDGVPSCTAPLRQQELIPTLSDMMKTVLGNNDYILLGTNSQDAVTSANPIHLTLANYDSFT